MSARAPEPRDLADALRAVVTAAQHWRRCLMVERAGIGRCDPHALRAAAAAYRAAIDAAAALDDDSEP